jgi:hypothetical protein
MREAAWAVKGCCNLVGSCFQLAGVLPKRGKLEALPHLASWKLGPTRHPGDCFSRAELL